MARAGPGLALDELAASIAQRGVIQPIVVRSLDNGRYQLVAGERRWRAAQKAQIHSIPALVRDDSDAAIAEIALIENIQRQDLNAIEEAEGYKALIANHGHGQDAVGITPPVLPHALVDIVTGECQLHVSDGTPRCRDRSRQRISPPMRLRTNRPTYGPARSVAIDPAAELAAVFIGLARDFFPRIAPAAIDAPDPIAAPAARLAALPQMPV